MAIPLRHNSNHVSSGRVDGTGSALDVICGFKPKAVFLWNVTGLVRAQWDDGMPIASMAKMVDAAVAGTVGNEAAHTHAVALDSGSSEAVTGGTPAQTTGASVTDASAGTPAGAVTGQLDLAVPAFNGTGFATLGQVITTTDNQTMAAVNSAAGMWFIANGLASSPPVLILSNTIVAGAPAVLTVQGVPPVTDAGTYKIVTLGAASFVGAPMAAHSHAMTQATYSALGTHSHGAGTLADAASAAGSSHTHSFSGTAGGMSYVTSNGIIPLFNGFTIGADTDVNVAAELLFWVAMK